jgi:hypothetical protein
LTRNPATYFQAVRIYAALESLVFAALLVVWIGDLDPDAKTVLGWVHGWGWILLCLLVAWGFVKRVFPGPLLAATVSPLGPLGALIGFEVLVRRASSTGTVRADVPSEHPARPDALPHPARSGRGGGAARRDAERIDGGRDRVRGGRDN